MKVHLTKDIKDCEDIYIARGAHPEVSPDLIFFIPGVACEGLFLSKNGQAAFPHGFFTNPNIDKESRSMAIDLLISSLIQYCMYHEIKFIHSGARKGSFANKFIAQGFVIEEGEYQSAYMRL